jgi:hypothetical protein
MAEPMTVKLTKKILMAAPEGAYLVSNCYSESTARSIFEEIVSPLAGRVNQWERIVTTNADQRTCRVFPTKKEYQEWLENALSPKAKR